MINFFSKPIFAVLITLTFHFASYANASNFNVIQDYYTHQAVKRTPEEIKYIKEIITTNKRDTTFNYRLGELFLEIGKTIDAEVIFKELYENHPSDKHEIAYGKALLAQEKSADILQIVQLNGLTSEMKAQKYFLQASAQFYLKRYEKGLKLVDTAIFLDKNIPVFFLLKARLLTALGKTNVSMLVLDTIPELNKKAKQKINLAEVDIARAENYVNTKDYLKALSVYNTVIAKNPDNLSAYAGRGITHLQLNNLNDAFKDSLFLAQNDPGNHHAIFIIGKVLNNQKKYDEALNIYDSTEANSDLKNLLSHAEINFNAKNYEKARILLNKYLRQDFENPVALKLRGILKLKEGNSRDALGDLKIAYKLNPYEPYIMIALAHAYYDLGQYKQSRVVYETLRYYFPKFQGISEVAFELSCKLRKSLSINDKKCNDSTQSAINEQIFKAMQFMYIGFEEYALEEVQKTLKIYPNNMTIIKNYLRILKHTNEIDDAVNLLFKILTKYPNDADALSELNSIYLSGKSSVDIFNKMQILFAEDKKSVNIGYYLANFYYKNKNYTKALQMTDEMIKRNTNTFKMSDLYEIILKIMMHKPEKFEQRINLYLEKYLALNDKKHLPIRLLRQNIIQSNLRHLKLRPLDLPAGEETAKDYQIYAEYLRFIGSPKASEIIYQSGAQKFPDNFEFFQSAFEFYKNPSKLQELKDSFTNFDPNYQTFLQAKIYLQTGEKEKATHILKKQFLQEHNGILADLLLQIKPDDETILMVNTNIKKIKSYAYIAHYRLAKTLYDKYRFSEASNLLLPFLSEKKKDFDFKLLLTQATFHVNYKMSYNLFKQFIAEYPYKENFLIENIAYEVNNKNYKNAIYLFEKYKPQQEKYPHIYYYYGYALINTNQKERGIKIFKELLSQKKPFFERTYAQQWLLKK